jgi:hypothetical protein
MSTYSTEPSWVIGETRHKSLKSTSWAALCITEGKGGDNTTY